MPDTNPNSNTLTLVLVRKMTTYKSKNISNTNPTKQLNAGAGEGHAVPTSYMSPSMLINSQYVLDTNKHKQTYIAYIRYEPS